MTDEGEEESLLETLIRIGSMLLPASDGRPSTAIANASYDLQSQEVEFTFKSGHTATYACDPQEWASYKTSPTASAGEFANQFVNPEHGTIKAYAKKTAAPKSGGFKYPKRF